MEALIEKQELIQEMAELPDKDEILYVDLKGRDPDEGFTRVPYVKGMLFLRRLEEIFGRARFDTFLRGYFNQFAFKSIVTGDFVDYLQHNLLDQNPDLASEDQRRRMAHSAWFAEGHASAEVGCAHEDRRVGEAMGVGQSRARTRFRLRAGRLRSGCTSCGLCRRTSMQSAWPISTAHSISRSRATRKFSRDWLLMSIRSGYQPAYPKLDRFLIEVGRRKYIKPLYQELAKTPEGKEHAKAVYAKARPGYHPIAVATIDDLLK